MVTIRLKDCKGLDHLVAMIAVGGIVALHDSRSTPHRPLDNAGSVQFTEKVIRHDTRFDVIDEIDSLTVLYEKVFK